MSKTKYINTGSYTMVAEAKGQEVIYYNTFGSYEGEWLMVSRDKNNYFFYKEGFGSCSGCDNLESEGFEYDGKYTAKDKKVQDFVKGYTALAQVPRVNVKAILTKSGLGKILNKKFVDSYSDINLEDASRDILILLKLWEGVVKPEELLDLRNLEMRREAIEKYGEDKYVADIKGVTLDIDEENSLIKVVRKSYAEPFVFLNLKDSSTPRRYLMRVPPETTKVKEGIAWTFGIEVDQYKPIKET